MRPAALSISYQTKGTRARVPFGVLYQKIMPRGYELSLTFVTPAVMRKLSLAHKGDPTHMNVLSFPLSKNSGEIIICLETAKRECLDYNRGCNQHVKFLVIHGMLHLAGYVHGSKMETEEKRLMETR